MKQPNITDLKPFPEVIDGLEVDLRHRGDSPDLALTTMPNLSRLLWGIHKQKLCVIGARTSNGKSTLAINIGYDLAMQGKIVMFLSLEMPVNRIVERVFCLDQSVDNIELLRNGYNRQKEIRDKYGLFKEKSLEKRLLLSDCIHIF